MIKYGQSRNNHENLTLLDGALDELVEQDFDIAISLFNVANCVDSIRGLKSFFRSIASRLQCGGVLVFEIWNATETILVPPKVVEREYKVGNTYLKRIATPYISPHDGLLRLEYEISGQDGDEPVAINSVHNIYLHPVNVVEYCLEEASFGSINWFSALSEGMNAAVSGDRMLLCCARKQVS
jgi:hypothetical protein